jgi:hypothetical protein
MLYRNDGENVTYEILFRQSPSRSRADCPSSGPRPVRTLRRGLAAGLLCPALASRWRGGG